MRGYAPAMPLRVVFDSNAFHGPAFDALEAGPFLSLCRRGRITPIYAHTFINETLNAYAREDRRDDLVRRWLPLISQSTGALCRDLSMIWHAELMQGLGMNARRFCTPAEFRNVVAEIEAIPIDGSWAIWRTTQARRDKDRAKQTAQRELASAIRRQAAEWARENKRAMAIGLKMDLRELAAPHEITYGRDLILKQVQCHNPEAIANRWERNRAAYPFFSQFAKNMVYAFMHALTQHNKPIDRNAQTDLDIMTHLLHADLFVSNETGFAKTAFSDLWKPGGKAMMTSAEFEAFIARL